MPTLDELEKNLSFTKARKGKATFLPEPPRQERKYTIISVDDHVVEPPDMFEGRMPSKYAGQAPQLIERDNSHIWVYDGKEFPNIGFNAVIGRPVSEYGFEPARFDDMRRGAWDIHARIADMDLSGIYASLCFPSALPGFGGQRLQLNVSDSGLALATVRAWNDWMLEEWCGAYPDRMIPSQIAYLLDPEIGAAEIRRNAARGFKAVSFSEAPHMLGLPSLHSGHWDPFLQACEETETVINLHIGSSGSSPGTSDDAPPDVAGTLFFAYSMFAVVDWLFSKVPVRYPNLKIVSSEGGIGWVAALLDRLDHMTGYSSMYGTWDGIDISPADVLKRNFWFCAVEDPSAFALRHRIGVENILLEQDYPHCDSTWPGTQGVVHQQIGGLPDDEIARFAWKNASELYRHEVPENIQRDPDAF